MDIELLRFRSAVFRAVRAFFDGRNYLEVDTPLLSADLIPESCLEVFETELLPPRGSRMRAKSLYLIPSPEIWMKKIIAGLRAGGARMPAGIYQICRCFRNGESSGRIHSPEFTMLEYYSLGADCGDSLALTEELFARLLPLAEEGPGREAGLSPPFERIAMGEAFARWAGFDLYRAASVPGGLETEARRLGLDPLPGLDRGALYDLIFVDRVEPSLPRDRPVALCEYPAFVPCLAKKTPGGKTVERWELYGRGIELANCYTEETSPRAVREFFEGEKRAKEKSALVRHRVDDAYWKIFLPSGEKLPGEGPPGAPAPGARPRGEDPPGRPPGEAAESGFPPCSGVALGMDRLIMALAGETSIGAVLPFS
jgi:lysyl-tRNA synthetase class 2